MLHRITWIAIPTITLVVVGGALGWWGLDQQQQRQALSLHVENQYASSFHGLVANLGEVETELGKSLVSGDDQMFRMSIRHVWRLSGAAQSDIAELPLGLMPMNHTQQFLSRLSHTTAKWIDENVGYKNSKAQQQLRAYYRDASVLTDQLTKLEANVEKNRSTWLSAEHFISAGQGQRDNQVVDGFRKMDHIVGGFAESAVTSTTPNQPRTKATNRMAPVNSRQAISALGEFIGIAKTEPWTARTSGSGAVAPMYVITGKSALGDVTGVVSQRGGHVLSFQLTDGGAMKQTNQLSLEEAQAKASQWLHTRGFGKIDLVSAEQYDGHAYVNYAPVLQGALVMNQTIHMRMSLYDGRVVGYDASNYFDHPVSRVPKAVYTPQQLQLRLNPQFLVGYYRRVIVKDGRTGYAPGVAFYGQEQDRSYCVYVNAVTGHEVEIEPLPSA